MTQGTTQLIAGVLGLVVFGGHVFFSIRAKPLGAKPYRFATYTAIGTGFLSLWFTLALVTEIRSGGRFGAVIVDMALVWGSFACSYGLFLRRRFGVVAFHGMCGLMLLSPLISKDVDAAELDRKMSAEYAIKISADNAPFEYGRELGFLLSYLVTSLYLGKRWKLLDRTRSVP